MNVRGRSLIVAALGVAGMLSPLGLGSAQAGESGCPAKSLCLFPAPDFQGEPRVLAMPRSWRAQAARLDDGHCLRMHVGSLIDNSGWGGWVYDNADCDNTGHVVDFEHRARIAKFNWCAKSLIFPVQDVTADP
jgi:hypothetical protein